MNAFSQWGSPGYFLLLILTLALAFLAFRLGRKKSNQFAKADELKARYARLTEEKIASIPDDRLTQAVAANILAKAEEKGTDPYYTIMTLSRGRKAFYGVWATVRELEEGSLARYLDGPTARFASAALDGFCLFDAPDCADILRRITQADRPEESLALSFREAVGRENPLASAARYIRENPDDFTDGETDPKGKE